MERFKVKEIAHDAEDFKFYMSECQTCKKSFSVPGSKVTWDYNVGDIIEIDCPHCNMKKLPVQDILKK